MTIRGGLVSIAIYILCLWQTIIMLQQFYTQEEPLIQSYSSNVRGDQILTLTDFSQLIQINLLHLDRDGLGESELVDPRAGKLTAYRTLIRKSQFS